MLRGEQSSGADSQDSAPPVLLYRTIHSLSRDEATWRRLQAEVPIHPSKDGISDFALMPRIV